MGINNIAHSKDKHEIYKYKLKTRHKPAFLGGREQLAMHRSGLPRAMFKTKGAGQ